MHEKIDLVSQPKKSFWKLSIPIIAFCIFDSIYGIVDMAWITQINKLTNSRHPRNVETYLVSD